MARMIPSNLDIEATAAQRQVFVELQNAEFSTEWLVLHSVRLPVARRRQRPRQVDFIILIPEQGIVCLSVNGAVFTEEDVEDLLSEGNEHPVVAVGQRLEGDVAAVRDCLERHIDGSIIRDIPIAGAAVFTETKWRDDDLTSTWQVYDSSICDVSGALSNALDQYAAQLSANSRPGFSLPMLDRVRRVLTPSSSAHYAWGARMTAEGIESELLHLTEEQYYKLDVTGYNDRCLIEGGAGTGKTMLALELARRRADAGDRVALLCYNRHLAGWLQLQTSASTNIAFVGAFWHDFVYKLVEHAGHDLWQEFSREMADARADNKTDVMFTQICPEYAERALQSPNIKDFLFDYVIMDEVQDICCDPYLGIINMLMSNMGGLNNGHWAFFGDFEQTIPHYDPKEMQSDKENMHIYCPDNRYLQIKLDQNCRNTDQIIAFVNQHLGTDIRNPGSVSGPDPVLEKWSDSNELMNLLDSEVRRLIDVERLAVEDIVILSTSGSGSMGLDSDRYYGGHRFKDYTRGVYWPRDAEAIILSDSLRSRQTDAPQTNEPEVHLPFSAARTFKGRESRAVIMIVKPDPDPGWLTRVQIGMLRAKVHLTVLAHVDLPWEK